MKVRATAPGFHTKLRSVGEEFEVPDGSKANWHEPVEPDLKSVKPKRGRPRKEPEGNADSPEAGET